MINNRYLPNEELLQKLLIKLIDMHIQNSWTKREQERYNAIYCEVLSRMNKKQESNGNLDVMTPKHPLWNRFYNMLYFRLTYEPCDADNLTQSKNILMKYFYDIDIEKSLEYFRNRGGYCDCEVLMNVN